MKLCQKNNVISKTIEDPEIFSEKNDVGSKKYNFFVNTKNNSNMGQV